MKQRLSGVNARLGPKSRSFFTQIPSGQTQGLLHFLIDELK